MGSEIQIVDLRSDTLSKPSMEMRKAIFEAPVGDDVYGEDPTVIKLEQKSAMLMGKEAGLFVSTGTMSNLLAVLTHCDTRGCELIAGSLSHILMYENTGAAQLGGVNIREVKNNEDGTFDLQEMRQKIRPLNCIHQPKTTLICVENTHNMCGGKVLPLKWLDELYKITNPLGIPLHLDGARIFNAAIVSGVPVSRLAENFDSVNFCLSKGLGCPIGSMLVGSQTFINKARQLRKLLGGATRQAGIVAAAGLHALDNMVDRLSDDHSRIQLIAKAIRNTNSKVVTVPSADRIHSNILLLTFNNSCKLSAEEFAERLEKVTAKDAIALNGDSVIVKISLIDEWTARIVTCCNLNDQQVDSAIKKIVHVIHEYGNCIAN